MILLHRRKLKTKVRKFKIKNCQSSRIKQKKLIGLQKTTYIISCLRNLMLLKQQTSGRMFHRMLLNYTLKLMIQYRECLEM